MATWYFVSNDLVYKHRKCGSGYNVVIVGVMVEGVSFAADVATGCDLVTMYLQQYGDIRTLYTACKHRGFVMISYYDIRVARNAMRALKNKPLRCRKLDIHFSIPKDNPSEKDINQGTLVVFNLDFSVPNDDLR